MSSFFTAPGLQKKRKRIEASNAPKKRIATSKDNPRSSDRNGSKSANKLPKKQIERDESISGSESEDDDSIGSDSELTGSESSEESEKEGGLSAADQRRRLAERYLDNVRQQVDETGFDAADIDRDLINERLIEDVAETKGKIYRKLANELRIEQASYTFFRNNTHSFTAVTANAPYVYTATKDLYIHKWKIQELPENQFLQPENRKSKKPRPPPRRKPELVTWLRGNGNNAKQHKYMRHVDQILAIAVSPDGKYLATGGADRKLIIYNAANLNPIKVFTHHRDAVTGLAFRRGTNQLYSCSKDRTVKVWSLDELAYVETLFGHQDDVVDIDALAQERCVSVGARDRTARLWKVAEESQLVFRGGTSDKKTRSDLEPASLPHETCMDRVAMLDDDLFVTGSDNGSLSLWSVQRKKPLFVYPLAHGLDPALEVTKASAEIHPRPEAVPPRNPRWITALRTIPYSDVFFSGSWDGHVRAWRLSEDKKKIEALGPLSRKDDGAQSPDFLNGVTRNRAAHESLIVHGVINDIAIFERGEKGKDGICLVAAFGKEHRLGRWKVEKSGRNGGMVFEIPRSQTKEVENGVPEDEESSDDD
jgi:ribosomal RNA-processing protein 9